MIDSPRSHLIWLVSFIWPFGPEVVCAPLIFHSSMEILPHLCTATVSLIVLLCEIHVATLWILLNFYPSLWPRNFDCSSRLFPREARIWWSSKSNADLILSRTSSHWCDRFSSLPLDEDGGGHSCTCSDWLGKSAMVSHFRARSE